MHRIGWGSRTRRGPPLRVDCRECGERTPPKRGGARLSLRPRFARHQCFLFFYVLLLFYYFWFASATPLKGGGGSARYGPPRWKQHNRKQAAEQKTRRKKKKRKEKNSSRKEGGLSPSSVEAAENKLHAPNQKGLIHKFSGWPHPRPFACGFYSSDISKLYVVLNQI